MPRRFDRFDVYTAGLLLLYALVIALIVGAIWTLTGCTSITVNAGSGTVEKDTGVVIKPVQVEKDKLHHGSKE